MANHEDKECCCLLISIRASNRDALFDGYRDYLVFMSLIRDGVLSSQYKVYGFSWIKNQCLLLIQPDTPEIGGSIIRLLKRYHFWLLQNGPTITEFKLQMLELNQPSWILDCLRYLHQHAVIENIVDDAMDYHWHSHHVYNGFWSMNWLDTHYILNQFANNRLIAMNRFRQYMLHGHSMDFKKMLDENDCSTHYIKQTPVDSEAEKPAIAEINSKYHQSLLERTQLDILIKNAIHYICISVTELDIHNSRRQRISS